MSETTIIARVERDGLPIGRVVAHDDYDAPCMWEGPHGYCDPNGVTVRAVSLPSGTREDYYETADHSEHDAAWVRITSGENAEGIGQYLRTTDEGVELFVRYMRVFHPLVSVIVRTVRTGYSQGDWAHLIAWKDYAPDGRPGYLVASEAHEHCEGMLSYIGAFARGQFISVAYEALELIGVDLTEDTMTAGVEWSEVDRLSGIMYLEELEPRMTALQYVEDVAPEGADIVPV